LNFSNAFKEELGRQLLEQFEIKLDSKNILNKHFFALFIDSDESEIREAENYIFMNVDILSPDSMARPITIGWNSETIIEKQKIHSQLNENDKIQFFYFTDLPIEELKNYLIKNKKIKNQLKTTFEYRINYENFPDLTLKIGTKNDLTKVNKEEINKIVTENLNQIFPSCWSSPFLDNSISFDFQINSTNFGQIDLENVEKLFNKVISKISESDFSQNIEYIIVE